MSTDLARLREILNKVPFRLLVPFFFLAFYVSILLCVAVWPLHYLYGWLLCSKAWVDWEKEGKDVLIIQAESPHSQKWMAELSPLISHRAVVLNWSERKLWERWSLPVQLFEVFGQGMPVQFTEFSLPLVIVFRRLRRPKKFAFGTRSKDLEARLENLRAALDLN